MTSATTYPAIVFPPNCLQVAPSESSETTNNSSEPSHLQVLPTEILTTILPHLTPTSRVNLALTCNSCANLLTSTPNILSFSREDPSSSQITPRTCELITDDQPFRCYLPPLVPELYDEGLTHDIYVMTCECCHKRFHSSSPNYLYKHLFAHPSGRSTSWILTPGMFRLMERGWQLRIAEYFRLHDEMRSDSTDPRGG